MGKASKWFRGLLGLKNSDTTLNPPPKRKWSFSKPHPEKDRHKSQQSAGDNDAAGKHAIAVATATAAVAEAAVAAAQAAASVVQLTSSGPAARGGWDAGPTEVSAVLSGGVRHGSLEEWAAVTIQSHFRAYLARRALRALKALVKLQALVRGHLVRKQTAYTLRRLQALVRAQVRARASRCLSSDSPHSSIKSSHFYYNGPETPEKFEHVHRARNTKYEQHLITMLKRNGSKSMTRTHHTDEADKILEVDTENIPHAISKRRSLFYSSGPAQHSRSFSTSKDSLLSQSSTEVQSLTNTSRFPNQEIDDSNNSPTYYSASSRGGSSRRGAFTPTKSEGSRSFLSGYSNHPNYMAYTESSKAKTRSISAPKQRPVQNEKLNKRYSVHANFASKGYPGSGRLDRLGMPISGEVNGGLSGGLTGGYWQRC